MRSKMARWLLAASLLTLVSSPVLAAGRGWLGVTTQPTDDDLRRGLELTRDGLLVNQVSDGSPADRAGLQKGDVILTYNSRSVTEPEELRQLVRETRPGRTVSLGIWRDGSRRTLQVEVGELSERDQRDEGDSNDDEFDTPTPPSPPTPPTPPAAPRAPRAPRGFSGDGDRRVFIDGREVPDDEIDQKLKDMKIKMKGLKGLDKLGDIHVWNEDDSPNALMAPIPMSRGRLGVRVEKLNGDLAQALGADGEKGALVTEVLEDTPAQRAGIRAGDVIVKVEGSDVDDPDDLRRILADQEGKVSVEVLRRGGSRTIHAELDDRTQPRRQMGDAFRRRGQMEFPEPGAGRRGLRERTRDDSGSEADLRREIEDLKRELQELREQLREKR